MNVIHRDLNSHNCLVREVSREPHGRGSTATLLASRPILSWRSPGCPQLRFNVSEEQEPAGRQAEGRGPAYRQTSLCSSLSSAVHCVTSTLKKLGFLEGAN
jgi:hypothetical protein